MSRSRIGGVVMIFVGAYFLTRSLRTPTASHIGAIAGGVLIGLGLVRTIWPRRARLI